MPEVQESVLEPTENQKETRAMSTCPKEHIGMSYCAECGWIPASYRLLEAEIARLKAENEILTKAVIRGNKNYASARGRAEAAEARNTELERYAHHLPNCVMTRDESDCTCGYSSIKREVRS